MMTIDIETISGVPFTGELKSGRPATSATTRRVRRNGRVAAKACSTFAVRSVQRCSNSSLRSRALLDLVPDRPLVAELLGFLERDLQDLASRHAALVELGGLFLRPALQRLRPFHAHRVRKLPHVGADALQLVDLLRIVL